MTYIDFHTHRKVAEGVLTPRCCGLHPWDVESEECRDYGLFREKYWPLFLEADVVGECGLDKVCGSDWQLQRKFFGWQLMMARELDKPVVVHCVRAFNEVIEYRKEMASGAARHLPPWIVHGFQGSLQLAGQLYRSGIWVSFGAALLDKRRLKVMESLRGLTTPFLLETDDSPCGIAAVYAAAAEARCVSIAELGDTIKETYSSLFRR